MSIYHTFEKFEVFDYKPLSRQEIRQEIIDIECKIKAASDNNIPENPDRLQLTIDSCMQRKSEIEWIRRDKLRNEQSLALGRHRF